MRLFIILLGVLRCVLFSSVLSSFQGCAEHPLPDLVEASDFDEAHKAAYLTWHPITHYQDGTPVPPDKAVTYNVYFGPQSRFEPGWQSYAYQRNSGRIAGYMVPPLLTGAKRWYFAVTAVDQDSGESSFSDEVSKFVE